MAENENMTLDEYVTLPQRYIVSGGLDRDEIRYKLRIAQSIAKARAVVLEGASDWREVLMPACRQKNNNLVNFRSEGALSDWIYGHPDDALDAMRALWAEDDTPISDRIRDFVPRVKPGPKYQNGFVRPGTSLRLIAALLMALDPKEYPPFMITSFKKAYERTGYPMPPKGADEAALYEHALGFLDKLVKRAAARGFVRPCNRLEAQSIVWSYQWPKEIFGTNLPDTAGKRAS